MNDYERIEKAIQFVKENFRAQPNLEEIAEAVYLSPYHFQKLFKEWAGVSPKKFLQFISIEHARILLRLNHSIDEVSYEIGLSGSSRLHDLFINIEGMTPGAYKNGGKELKIKFNYDITPFGEIIIASTNKGICHLSFINDKIEALVELKNKFPNANYQEAFDETHKTVLKIFNLDWDDLPKIKLHLKATKFQLKVWEALLRIPFGQVTTYSTIASNINNSGAGRAVGNAIAANPVAYLIPCHRVIKSTGEIGEYHWGHVKKNMIIGWENSKTNLY